MSDNVIITVRDNLYYKIRRLCQKGAYLVFGPVIMAKVYYRLVMKSKLNLKNPTTFNEKINWYKLYYCPKNELIIKCSDKYDVREFLLGLGFERYLSRLICSWDNPDDICWDELPRKFALKNSNGCGYNIICKDKSSLSEKVAKKLLKKWLNDKFGYYNAEPHYNIGKKRIICEEYIDSGNFLPIDYKIHCMNGIPKVVQVCDERTSKTTRYTYFDASGNPLEYGKYPSHEKLDIDADLLKEMNDVSFKIASYFPYVRVDFFINAGKLQISELTFSPSAGLKPDLIYGGGDVEMGKMLDLKEMVNGDEAKN